MSRVTRSMSHTGLGLREGPTISRGLGRLGVGSSFSPSTSPPPTFYFFFNCPPCFRDTPPCRNHAPRPMTEIPPILPGNQELARAISRAGTPRLAEPASPSPSQRTTAPLAPTSSQGRETASASPRNWSKTSPPMPLVPSQPAKAPSCPYYALPSRAE